MVRAIETETQGKRDAGLWESRHGRGGSTHQTEAPSGEMNRRLDTAVINDSVL
jgi:hypothetical protein